MRDTVGDQDLTFGSRLRQLREAAGLTQEELALRAGLSPRAISALERGERQRPYPHTVPHARGRAGALRRRTRLPPGNPAKACYRCSHYTGNDSRV
jgi:DNA-binding XRE family transcriptional regulator